MDEQNRTPDPQSGSRMQPLSEPPAAVPAEQPPAWEMPEGRAPAPVSPAAQGETGSPKATDAPPPVPAAPPYGIPADNPYTVPPASPYGTAPGTPYGVPPAYPAGSPPVPSGYGVPVPPPYGYPGGGYPPSGFAGTPPAPEGNPAGPSPEWGGASSIGFFGGPAPLKAEAEPDPNRLRILVGGRPLSPAEYLDIVHLSSGHGTTLLIAVSLLVLLFGWMAVGDAVLSGNQGLMSATFLLVLASALLLILGVAWDRSRLNRKRKLAYSTMMADPAAAQGHRLEFYDDRIEMVSARGTSTLFLSDITAYIETTRVLALVFGNRYIYVRAQDLTVYDAGLIRSFLRARVPAKLVRIKAPLIPCLYEPLPIPAFSNSDEVLARACVPYSKKAERRSRMRRFWSTLPVVLPMLLLLSTAMAQYAVLSNWFLLDVAAFFVGFAAVYLLAGAVLLAAGLRPPAGEEDSALHLAITRDGVAFYQKGAAGFAVRACVRPAADAGGIRLILPYTSYFVPESAMEQPTQFRAVLGL